MHVVDSAFFLGILFEKSFFIRPSRGGGNVWGKLKGEFSGFLPTLTPKGNWR